MAEYTGDDEDVTNFVKKSKTDSIPGLPKLDPRRVVRNFSVVFLLFPHLMIDAC